MAKSKSTSDTCSKCGKRIDKCVPPCPVAVSLQADKCSFVEDVCNLFDLQLLTDISEPTNHVAPCPKVDGDEQGRNVYQSAQRA